MGTADNANHSSQFSAITEIGYAESRGNGGHNSGRFLRIMWSRCVTVSCTKIGHNGIIIYIIIINPDRSGVNRDIN